MTTTPRFLTLLTLIAALLPAIAGQTVAQAQMLDGCVLPGVDDRCETWTVIDDPEPDPQMAYQQPSALDVSPSGELVVTAGYSAQDLFDTAGEARSRWRLLASDAVSGAQRWLVQPGPDDAYARPLGVDATDTTVIATGYASSGFGARDASALVVAVDATDGAVLWETALTPEVIGRGSRDVRGWFVSAVEDGPMVVLGTFGRPPPARGQSLFVATLDADDGTLNGLVVQEAGRRGQASDGNLALPSIGLPGQTLLDAVIAGDGEEGPAGTAVPAGLFVSSDGRTVYVGATDDGSGEFDIDMLAFAVDVSDPAQPRITWRHRDDGIGTNAPDRLDAMTMSDDDRSLFLAGISGNDPDGVPFDVDYDVMVTAVDTATGEVQWRVRDDLGVNVVDVQAVAEAGDNVVVVGARSIGGASEGLAAAYDRTDGASAWTTSVTTPGMDRESLYSVDGDNDTLVVAGISRNSRAAIAGSVKVADSLVASLDTADGRRLWTARHNTTDVGDDAARQVVLHDGDAYVLGSVTRNVENDRNFYDLSVLAYRQDG